MVHGSLQARGRIRAVTASLYHSHSNVGSEPNLHHSLRSRQILNPSSKTRDQICIFMDTSWVLNLLSHNRNYSTLVRRGRQPQSTEFNCNFPWCFMVERDWLLPANSLLFPFPHLHQDPAFCDTYSTHPPASVTDPNEARFLSGYKPGIHSLRGEEFTPQASLNDMETFP